MLYSLPIAREWAMATRNERIDEPTLHAPNGFFHPSTDLEREEVRKQLRQILASPVFQNSKRYAAVLKYIVDQTLSGCGDKLKERTIGIEVFERAPAYDTATDHVVRSAASEVRKRLAQYYQENAHGQLRIDVLPGSYTPQFRWAEEPAALPSSPSMAVPTQNEQFATSGATTSRIWLRPKRIFAAVLILTISLVAGGVALLLQPRDPFEAFWKPVLTSRAPVLLCIGNVAGGRGAPGEVPNQSATLSLDEFHMSPAETINVYDVITMTKFATLMVARGQRFELKAQSDVTFTDLQRGPAVLIGLMNNSWSERLVPDLRFTVEYTTPKKVIIRDRKNPLNQDWTIDYSTPYLDVSRDYALVLRMADPKTEQTVVVAAGITVFGTYAAGDFLTNRNEMRKLAAIAPPGWEKKNMELVLSTDVIRGRSGPATIVAAQFW